MDIASREGGFPRPDSGLKILLTGVSSDSHTWNLVFLQLLMEYYGHKVVNLGACVPDELVVEACNETDIDMLVVSSVNGHGYLDGARLVRAVRESISSKHLPCIIGGKLGTKGAENSQYINALHEAGFDAVYSDDGGAQRLEEFMDYLLNLPRKEYLANELQ